MAADRGGGGNVGGISLGGVLVIVGIVLMIVWSFWVGLIVALVGLVAFSGFAKGKWYLALVAPLSRSAHGRRHEPGRSTCAGRVHSSGAARVDEPQVGDSRMAASATR